MKQIKHQPSPSLLSSMGGGEFECESYAKGVGTKKEKEEEEEYFIRSIPSKKEKPFEKSNPNYD